MVWKADSLQGVLFTMPGVPQLDAQQMWGIVTDTLPENVQRPASTPNGLTIASGAYNGYNLRIQSQLGRIDWILNGRQSSSLNPEPPQIEDYDRGLGIVSDLMMRSLSRLQPIRVALVGELSKILPSDADVSAFLTEQTGGIWFPQPAQDCIYQVNARKHYAGDAEMLMNRIVTWSGSSYQLFTAPFPAPGIGPGMFSPAGFPVVQEVLAATLKIDINSATSEDISANVSGIIAANQAEISAIAKQGLAYLK